MFNDTIQGLSRTHYCGELRENHIGQSVTVAGWVQKNRDKGSLVFVDLRDRTGIVQLVFDDSTPEKLRKKGASVRAEYVLMAKVRFVSGPLKPGAAHRPCGDFGGGAADSFQRKLPFEITDQTNVKEELRLRYRYLIAPGEMQHNLIMRHRIVKAARDFYDRNGFLELETPLLIKSTPKGRDYLVPSRVHPGKFFALPQSPQLYKQLLMLSGYDRYMQIAKCFRDEDLRADRQPEFTQIDVEMSFVDEDDVMNLNEAFMVYVFKEVLGVDLPTPFRRIPLYRGHEPLRLG